MESVVRVVQRDHRRLEALTRRLQRPYRDPELRRVLAAELAVHAELHEGTLRPFASSRVSLAPASPGGATETLRNLSALLDVVADPVAPFVVEHVSQAVNAHIRDEDATLLNDLQRATAVETLREVGTVWDRRRRGLVRAAQLRRTPPPLPLGSVAER